MPRRVLLLLTAVVLALHWLALMGLPLGLGGTGAGTPQRMAFHTRMVEPPPPPAAQEAAPPPAPAPRPRPKRKPAPPAAQEDAPASTVPDAAPSAPPAASPDEAAPDATAGTEAEPAVPEAPALPASVPQAVASAPSEAAAESAGVDILPPGAAGATPGTAPPPVRLPPPARLAFEVSGQVKQFTYQANAELVWRHDGERYEARQQVKAFLLGSRTQTSVGQVTAAGLVPERFGDKSRSEQAAHFDFGQGKVIFSANTPQAAIGPGAQDRLSVFIQLGALLAAAPEGYPTGTQITLTTVSARNADRWTFTVEGAETLDLPAGPTPALKLQRLPRRDRDQKAELWLGTQLGYLPVRIRLTQSGGDFADLRLSGHEAP